MTRDARVALGVGLGVVALVAIANSAGSSTEVNGDTVAATGPDWWLIALAGIVVLALVVKFEIL